MQVEIQGDFVLSLHDCHAYAAAADFSAKLFSGELAGHSNSSLAIILPAMFQPLGVFLIRQQIQDFPQEAFKQPDWTEPANTEFIVPL